MNQRIFVVLVLVVCIVFGLVKIGGSAFAISAPCGLRVGVVLHTSGPMLGLDLIADGPVCLPHEVCGPQKMVIGSKPARVHSGIEQHLAGLVGMLLIRRLPDELVKDGPVCLPHEPCGPGMLG